MVTYITGAQHTGSVNALQRKLEIHEKIYYLQEDLSPLVILTWGKGKNGLPTKKHKVGNPEFKVMSKEPHEAWTAINYSTGYTATATTFVVDAAAHITVGMLLQDSVSGEIMYVNTVTSATQIEVDRSIGTTAAGSIADNVPLLIIGGVNAENATTPTYKRVKVRDQTNYCQIMREPIGSSDTLANSNLIGGQSRTDLRKEAWLEWRKRVERAFLFGEPFEDTSVVDANGYPTRGTGGVYYWLNNASHVTSVATTLTKAVWKTFSRNLFKYNGVMGRKKVVLCSPLVCEALNTWKDSKLEFKPSDLYYNISIAQWTDSNGTMIIIRDEELDDSTYGSGGHGGMAIGLSPENLEYCYLKNRDAKLLTNRQNPGVDGWVDEILAECGLGFINPETGWALKGITEYATT